MEQATGKAPDPGEGESLSRSESESSRPISPASKLIVAAGITDTAVDIGTLTDEQLDERATEIDRIVMEAVNRKQASLSGDQLSQLTDDLVRLPYTIAQIQRAAEEVTRMDGFSRPLAWEHWQKAFSQPSYSGQEVQRLVEDARRDTRDQLRDESRAELQADLERQRAAIYEKGFEEGRQAGFRETLAPDTLAALDTLDELRNQMADQEDSLRDYQTRLLSTQVELLEEKAAREDAWLKASAIVQPSLEPREVECPNCRKAFLIQLTGLTHGDRHSRKGGRHGKAA